MARFARLISAGDRGQISGEGASFLTSDFILHYKQLYNTLI
jgi:hypothetical protein